jgi:molybdopterin synthase sulfur carrier subunit
MADAMIPMSMRIQVKYYGVAREVVGKLDETVELESGSTVMDLIFHLIDIHGESFERYIFDGNGKIMDYFRFVVNDYDIMVRNKHVTILKDGDRVLVLPPIGGG